MVKNMESQEYLRSPPRLPILTKPLWVLQAEASGMMTPPFGSAGSVPFKWEETPGKAKPSAWDEQLQKPYLMIKRTFSHDKKMESSNDVNKNCNFISRAGKGFSISNGVVCDNMMNETVEDGVSPSGEKNRKSLARDGKKGIRMLCVPKLWSCCGRG